MRLLLALTAVFCSVGVSRGSWNKDVHHKKQNTFWDKKLVRHFCASFKKIHIRNKVYVNIVS